MNQRESKRHFKYTELIFAIYVTIILATACLANRFIQIGSLVMPGGLPTFPLTFLLMFSVGEVYGYKYARRFIWIGFFLSLFFALLTTTITRANAPSFFNNIEAYETVFNPTLRFVLSSGIGLVVGEFANVFVNAKLKIRFRGQWFWLRYFTSVIFGQIVLSIVVDLSAFVGRVPINAIESMILSGFIWKGFFTLLGFFPCWLLVKYLKEQEAYDYYDNHTNFNPFKIDIDDSNSANSRVEDAI